MSGVYRFLQISTLVILAGAVSGITLASVPARIGPYRLQIYTEPAVIPVGKVRVRIFVTDASGKPVEGAAVAGDRRPRPVHWQSQHRQRARQLPLPIG